ncbi:MAG: hypothetical protein DMG14_04545 [Acidobacteria bacterium]|nr:MAG: hypothetical protein DMG14_04545 [Acidobacteriota bacterium]
MFVTKKHLSRRTFLKTAGATLALPFLESMVPAMTAHAAINPGTRLAFVYLPHGAIMDRWTPKTDGRDFEFTPILKALEPFRDYVNVISGLGHKAADSTAVHSLSDVAQRHSPEADARSRCVRRYHGGSNRGAENRPEHRASFNGIGD